MRHLTSVQWLRVASVMAIAALAFIVWSLFDPRAEPVLVALTVGQGIGTLSLALYVRVMVREYRGRKRASTPP